MLPLEISRKVLEATVPRFCISFMLFRSSSVNWNMASTGPSVTGLTQSERVKEAEGVAEA